jgi:AraC family transcriptional regulator of adaptative response / DNA-3-methyladenine glycosylase II
VLGLPDEAYPMPAARRATIRALARAVADGDLDLDPGADRADAIRRLTDLPGVGPWTANYVAMRALGDPDAFLPTDLGVRRGAGALGLPDDPETLTEHADRWRPWRSYAVVRLWASAGSARAGAARVGRGGAGMRGERSEPRSRDAKTLWRQA